MLTPEEDFDTWSSAVIATADTLDEFSVYVPQIVSMIDDIISQGKLKEPISENTEFFISSILCDSMNTVLGITNKINTEENETVQIFFKKLIDLSLHGLKILNKEYIDFAVVLLGNANYYLFTMNNDLNFSIFLISYAESIGFYSEIGNILPNENVDYDIFDKCFRMYSFAIKILSEKDFWNLPKIILKKIISLLTKDKRSGESQELWSILCFLFNSGIQHLPVDDEFTDLFVDTAIAFIKTDFFERKKMGLDTLRYILCNDSFMTEAARHFNDLQLLMSLDLHEQFIPLVGIILGKLAFCRKVTIDDIKRMWENRKVMHSSLMSTYLNMFVTIAGMVPADFLLPMTECAVESYDINFLKNFTLCLGNRQDATEAFSKMRMYFMNLAFSEESTPNIISILGEILSYHLSDDDFSNMLSDFMQRDTNTLMTVMKSIILTKKISEPVANSLIKRVIEFAKENPSQRSSAFNFIYGIVLKNSMKLNNDVLDQIFSLSNDQNFYFFASSMAQNNLLPYEYVEKFILENDVETKDQHFVYFIDTLINKLNEVPPEKLPFKGANILWKLCLTNKNSCSTFNHFLVKNYIFNNGITNKDADIIDAFTKDWMERYTEEKELQMFFILHKFIIEFESTIDTEGNGVVSHLNDANKIKYNIEVTGQYIPDTFRTTAYPDTSLFVIIQRVSEYTQIPPTAIKLTTEKNKNIHLLEPIERLTGSRSIRFYMEIIPAEQRVSRPPRRLLMPSVVFSNIKIFDMIYSAAVRGVLSAKFVMDALPHNPDSVLKIKELGKLHTTPEELFPIKNPFVFMYNIETASALMSPEIIKALDDNGVIDYFIRAIKLDKKHAFTSHIMVFLCTIIDQEKKKKYSESIFSTAFHEMKENSHDEYIFNTLARLISQCTILEEIKTLYDGFQEDVKFFLRYYNSNVKRTVLDIIKGVKIPLSLFESIIDDNPYAEFFTAAIEHVSNEYSDVLFDAAFKEVQRKSECTPVALKLIKELLKTKKVPEEKELELCKLLTSMFLAVNSTTKDSTNFVAAAECLGQMRNENLLNTLTFLHNHKSNFLKWDLPGEEEIRSTYSGLVNLGCTCFFNSILQQLYAIPPLRKKILEYNSNDMFMNKLKKLFAKMMCSNSPAQSTKGVVKYFIGWDGEPMDPHIQQDACEFLQVFLDKLEGTLGVDFIHKLFKGTTVNCIDGIDKEYHSERSEQFYTLQVPVKGFSNLKDSINSISTPDFLTGDNKYKAENIGLIDAKKSTHVGEMPPYLIIQLSRFEYEYQTMTRTKIDTRLEFPTDLTLNGEYTLTGVIVHMGGADFGHYISYVKDRVNNVWYCCNDQLVNAVSLDEVKTQSFGANSKSGYLLFYDRKDNEYDSSYRIDELTSQKIGKRNYLNNEYRVFCSLGYFTLAAELSKSEDPRFVEIALRYFFDSLPYTNYSERAHEISTGIIKMLNENEDFKKVLVNIINESKISTAILFSPDKEVREATLQMIKTIDPNQVYFESVFSLLRLIEYAPIYFASFNEYFCALHYFISGSQAIKLYATNNHWGSEIVRMLTMKFNDQAKVETNFYINTNLTGLFDLICDFELTPFLSTYCIESIALKVYLLSKTTVDSIVHLYKSLPSQTTSSEIDKDKEIASIVKEFLSTDGKLTARTVEFIIKYFGDSGFEIINSRSSIKSPASNYEITFSYYRALADPSNRPFFIKNIKKVIRYLFDIDLNCRTAAARCIYAMNPCKEFEEAPDVYDSEVDIPPTDKELNPEVVQSLEQCAGLASTNFSRCHEYIQLLLFAHSSAGSYLLDTQQFTLFDDRAMTLLKAANDVTRPTKFIVPLDSSKNYYQMLMFFEALAPHLMKHETTPETTKIFIESYAFITLNVYIVGKYKPIADYLIKCCQEQADICKEYICKKINEAALINLSAVCIAAEILQLKLPLVEHLCNALKSCSYLEPNVLVEKAFLSDDGTYNKIVSLLNYKFITGKARQLIWERVQGVSMQAFAKQYKGSDKEELAQFLKDHQIPGDKFYNSCCVFSMRSGKSFTILSDIIINEAIMRNKPFIVTLLTFDIESDSHAAAVVKLIKISGVTYPMIKKIWRKIRFAREIIEKGAEQLSAEEVTNIMEDLKRYVNVYRETSMENQNIDEELEILKETLAKKNIDDHGIFSEK